MTSPTSPTLPKRSRDLTGQIFSRLRVVRFAGTDRTSQAMWHCICECGGNATVLANNLQKGNSKSCGCIRRELITKHGMTRTPEYDSWNSMWQRCKTDKNYRDRTPPERWREFEVFLLDMGPKPGPDYSIERIENDKPYGPGNCKWATRLEQGGNRRDNINLTFNGKTQHLAAWCREQGLDRGTVHSRLLRGWGYEKAIFTPARKR